MIEPFRSSRRRCSTKKLFSFRNIHRKATVLGLFLIREKETPTQVLSREYCENFKNIFFEEHLQMPASQSFLNTLRPYCFFKNLFREATLQRTCQYLTVDPISEIFVILITHKAKCCNLKDCNLLKRNFTTELFMKHFLTFSKHVLNIVYSSNLVQPVEGESPTPVKWKVFKSF